MVLHGPSGSGKTSLVNCGFVKRIQIPKRAAFYLRRKGNFLDVLTEQISERNLGEEIGQHLHAYIDAQVTLIEKKQIVDDYNRQILELETQRRNQQDQQEEGPGIPALVKERDEVKKWIKNHVQVSDLEAEIVNDFNVLFSRLNTTPLFIFDQFEEIFIEGGPEERMRFGIFSQFMLKKSLPVNSLIIVDEEYFGHLDEFIDFVPRIFYNSVRLLDPDEKTARGILQKLLVPVSSKNVKSTQDQGTSGAQKDSDHEVIESIISKFRLEEKGGVDVENEQRIHLPYLQMCLKAYQDHYGSQMNVGNMFAFGKIDEVLEQYLRDLNDRILQKFGITKLNSLKQEYPVIKYLQSFVSKMTGKAQKIKKADTASFAADIWIIDPSEKLDMDKLNAYLQEEGVIEEYGGNLFLAHDSFAIPISNFNIREDLLRKDFETSFNVWKEQGENIVAHQEGKSNLFHKINAFLFPANLLSKGQVASMTPYKAYIIPAKEVERKKMKEYWTRSLRNVKKWNRIGLGLLMAGLLLAIGFAISFYQAYQNEKEALLNKEKAVKEEKENALKGKVYEGTGSAWNDYRNDRTSSFNEIQRSYLNWEGGDPTITGDAEFPAMVSDFQNVFYSDYNAYPFYSKNITIEGGGHITQTKTRMVGDSLYIFALTSREELYTYVADWKQKDKDPEEIKQVLTGIKHFEPFYDSDDKLKVLVIPKTGGDSLMIMLNLDKHAQPDTLIRHNRDSIGSISAIEHIGNYNFVISIGHSFYDLKIFNEKEFGIIYRGYVSGEIRQIRRLKGYKHQFIILYGRSGLYLPAIQPNVEARIVKHSNKPLGMIPSDKIYALSYDRDSGKMLLGYNNGIAIICNPDGTNPVKRDYQHNEAIQSISVEGDLIMVGSLDKTASIWRKNKRLKTLIGHSDALYNVSFVDGANYVISSGEDGQIKIWDLSPTFEQEATIPGRKAITQIKYDPGKSSYIVAYKSLTVDESGLYEGKVLRYSPSLKNVVEIYQDKKYGNGKGYINTFDFVEDVLVMAGNANQVITTPAEDRNQRILLTGITSTIHDIEIADSTIYIATTKGILYGDLYNNRNAEYDTLSKGHRVNSLDYSPDLKLLAAGREDWKVIFYQNNEIVETLNAHTDKVADVEFSETGKYFASGGWDNKLHVWRIQSGITMGKIFEGKHLNDVLDIDFYGDSLLLSASLDRTVKLYVETSDSNFEAIPSLISHYASVTAATFARNNNNDTIFVISGDRNGNIRRWDINSFRNKISSRTFDKIKSDKIIVDKEQNIKGKWELQTDSKSVQQLYPGIIQFKHPPDLTFSSKSRKNSKWIFGKWTVKEVFGQVQSAAKYDITSPRSIEIIFGDKAGDTLHYNFDLSATNDTLFLSQDGVQLSYLKMK
jgi:WD40 repeat protein